MTIHVLGTFGWYATGSKYYGVTDDGTWCLGLEGRDAIHWARLNKMPSFHESVDTSHYEFETVGTLVTQAEAKRAASPDAPGPRKRMIGQLVTLSIVGTVNRYVKAPGINEERPLPQAFDAEGNWYEADVAADGSLHWSTNMNSTGHAFTTESPVLYKTDAVILKRGEAYKAAYR